MLRDISIVTLLAITPFGVCAADPVSVAVYPTTIEISHQRQPHSIQVLATTADGFSLDLRDAAKFTSTDPEIATVDSGWVRPVSSGQTSISVSAGGQSFTIPVKVTLSATEPPISFRHEVMPVLTRSGCNAGACHGYSLGKNGFKLSLRGQDPTPDFFAMVKDSSGRRVSFQNPVASLLVAKARGDTPHEGGSRFAHGSLSDNILVKWIAQGTPADLTDPSQVVGVRVVPDKLVLKPGEKHRLQLIAEYSNGTKRDVTRLGVFAVNNDQFAQVSDEGLVTAAAAGETAVVGRFERTFAATGITVLEVNAQFAPAPVPGNLIDKPVVEKLNRLKISPSPLCTDEEYLRRVYLDVIGLQPKPDEVKAFLANRDPRKRAAVVEKLFERPEFVDQWSLKWGDLLQNSRNTVSSPAVFQFREFIRSAVAANMPLDEFARKILTARGSIS
ncbi:MAG TPA: DUF1549 domain-containing protein, partial [Gemmata sp.]|nr:DUF1549 domain-containing protein [Gemmata sp.]